MMMLTSMMMMMSLLWKGEPHACIHSCYSTYASIHIHSHIHPYIDILLSFHPSILHHCVRPFHSDVTGACSLATQHRFSIFSPRFYRCLAVTVSFAIKLILANHIRQKRKQYFSSDHLHKNESYLKLIHLKIANLISATLLFFS